jgi:peptide deformylase
MAIRPIITIGHKTLARKAAPVKVIDDEVKTLARDMLETLHAAPGIGLSAPQVDAGVRLIVIDLSIGENPDELIIMVNPEITSQEGSCVREEGCLSVPEVFEKVSRPQKINVRGLDLDGREKIKGAEDLLARVFCHEIDHLDGKLFIDRLSPLKRSLIRKRFKKAAAAKM